MHCKVQTKLMSALLRFETQIKPDKYGQLHFKPIQNFKLKIKNLNFKRKKKQTVMFKILIHDLTSLMLKFKNS